MTTHEASSSSSSKSKHWNYDVYLSFSSVDTRNGFTGHLHTALTYRGYQAYIDEENLKRGEIKEALFRAIEQARISIIVFSKSYADLHWCLDELVKIMECRYKLGQHVLPIFYHVDPSHVRKQNGDLAQAFQKHEEDIRKEKDDEKRKATQERVKQWRKALTEATDLSGQYLRDNGHEAKLIREIVDEIIPKWLLIVEELHVAKHPVGIYTRIQDIITYLSNGGSDVVRMVGIWGMGGLGKTTAAKAIYNKIHHEFQFKSFLADVSKYDLVDSQKKLVFDILKWKPEISSVDEGINLIKYRLQRRSVLVIIDNVDKVEQLNAIAGNRDWFGPGSRIIITTRDERLLKQVNMKVDKTYPLKEMNEEEALKLFRWHAFGNSWPDEEYLELSKEFVSYCGGLPLDLEVLGSSMIERTPTEWKSRLEKLKKFPDEGMMKSLRASEEALTHTEGDNKILPFPNRLFDGGINGRRIGKLVISSTEISKGSNGTIVLKGEHEGRSVAVKRVVLAHHDMASKEILNLIASDRHPNIVRWYGVEYDKDFVYISLELCICNLDDLIQICPNSSQNPVIGEEDAKRARIENDVRLKSLKNIMSDVNLWKVDGLPSLQLLKLMRDVVSGLVHLHEMGIIHRDLKPQNVLLIKERTLCAKLSDMGISKRLSGDMSSLGHLATGCGSSGWQAPEQLREQLHEQLRKQLRPERQTRAVDMFGLGCLLFYCITGGRHPFGDQLERDINIVNDQKNLFLVEHIPEAADLISRLLDRKPEKRPRASEVLLHPLFWDSEKGLSFLRDSSDRVELEDRVANSGVLTALESIAPIAFGGKWDEKMEDAFLTNISDRRYRRYKFDSVRDLLRVIRNKSNHYRELPQQIQELVGPVPEGFYFYFSSRFPRLLIEVYKVVCQNCREEECFGRYFKSNAD